MPDRDPGELDPLGVALNAIITGAAAGGALVCVVLLASYWMARGPDTPFATIALAGAGAGLLLAVLTAAHMARPLPSWRRVVAAVIGMAGAALVAVLTTAADMLAGRAGLLVLALLCLAAILGSRRLFRGAS